MTSFLDFLSLYLKMRAEINPGPNQFLVLRFPDAFSASIKRPGLETDRNNQPSAVVKLRGAILPLHHIP
jgi:hypothetical protein